MTEPVRMHLSYHTLYANSLASAYEMYQWISDFAQHIIHQIGELFFLLQRFCENQLQSIHPLNFFKIFSQNSPKNIIAFYCNNEANADGLRLIDILASTTSDEWLERNHRWIQWAFPLDTPSSSNPDAPVLDQATIAAFRNNGLFIHQVYPVFLRTLRFYGLILPVNKPISIERGSNSFFENRMKSWLYPKSHHFKRITRIIHSLTLLLGSDNPYGRAFFVVLENIYNNEGNGIIPLDSYHRWQRAQEAP